MSNGRTDFILALAAAGMLIGFASVLFAAVLSSAASTAQAVPDIDYTRVEMRLETIYSPDR